MESAKYSESATTTAEAILADNQTNPLINDENNVQGSSTIANLLGPDYSFAEEPKTATIPNSIPSDALKYCEMKKHLATSGQAIVFQVNWKSDQSSSILKVYKKEQQRIRKQRCFRELMALIKLKPLREIPKILRSNIPKDPEEITDDINQELWIVMNEITGCTLAEYMRDAGPNSISIERAVQLTMNLLSIVQRVHEKEIVHRDIKPTNIMIDINKDTLTLLDFGLAYVSTNDNAEEITRKTDEIKEPPEDVDFDELMGDIEPTKVHAEFGNRWYRVPQLSPQIHPKSSKEHQTLILSRRSPKIDSCSVTAILFWLLTCINPEKHRINNLAPHQRSPAKEKINEKILQASKLNAAIDMEQLTNYLLHTFDKGFEESVSEQWSDESLRQRLEFIQRLLTMPLATTVTAITLKSEDLISRASSKALSAFRLAKKHFSDNNLKYTWKDGGCVWLPQVSADKRVNEDKLFKEDTFLQISCIFNVVNNEFVMSIECDKIELPIDRFKLESSVVNINRRFEKELLILVTCVVDSIKKQKEDMLARPRVKRSRDKNSKNLPE